MELTLFWQTNLRIAIDVMRLVNLERFVGDPKVFLAAKVKWAARNNRYRRGEGTKLLSKQEDDEGGDDEES